MQLKYSVLICTFNGAPYIQEQLRSILNQTPQPEEIIISDDGSTDQTLSLCEQEFAQFDFENFRMVEGPKKGTAANFLTSIHLNHSEYLFLADQDDIWHSEKVAEYAKVIASRSEKGPLLICSDASVVDSEGNEIHPSFFEYQGLSIKVLEDDSIFFKNIVQGATVCINKEMIGLVGRFFGEEYLGDIVMHDWWMALVARYCASFKFIDKPLLRYRQHENNQIGAQSKLGFKGRIFLGFRRKARSFFSQLNQMKRFLIFIREAGCLNDGVLKRFEFAECTRAKSILVKTVFWLRNGSI